MTDPRPQRMDFRGAVVEDFNSPPCDAIFWSTKLAVVRGILLNKSFVLPPFVAIFEGGKVVGYLTAAQIESAHGDNEEKVVGDHLHFERPAKVSVSIPIESLDGLFELFPILEVWDATYSYLLSTLTEHDLTRLKGFRSTNKS